MTRASFTALLLLVAFCGCASPRQFSEPGPAFTFTVGTGEESLRSRASQLTVGTYNVHWLTNASGVRADLSRLSNVDVWCFQEIRVEGAADLPAASAERLASVLPAGKWHCAAVAVNRLAEVRSSDWEMQVVASRFPIKSAEVWPLDDTGSKRRVALAVTVSVAAERDVLVVNTDHEPSFPSLRDGNARQAAALLDRLGAVPASVAVVIAGDFNCSGNAYRIVGNGGNVRSLNARFDAAQFTAMTAPQPTFRSGVWRLRLDRIYVRGLQLKAANIDERATGSDHVPVWCVATFDQK